MLEFNCASACQSEPAEVKGGDGGKAPSGTQAVCSTVLTMKKKKKNRHRRAARNFFSPTPPPTQGCNYKSVPFLPRKKEAGHKEHSCQICLFSKGLQASKCQWGKNSWEAERFINKPALTPVLTLWTRHSTLTFPHLSSSCKIYTKKKKGKQPLGGGRAIGGS